MNADLKRQIELIQRGCRESLKFMCLKILNMTDWDVVHDELQAFLKSSGKRKHIEIPRGHLKSSYVTKAWSMQQVLINPNLRVLLANAVWDNSRKFLRSIQKYISRDTVLSQVFGTFESNHWNQDECTIAQRTMILDAPTWATTGIEKEQTSQHYDLIIADDLVTMENVQTVEQRQKVKDYFKGLLDLLEPAGTIVVIGTRKHQDDMYGMLLEQGGWDNFIRGCYDGNENPIFPKKFSKDYLAQLRKEKGSYFFACEYLNNPIDESTAPFKASQIRFYDAATLPLLSYFMTVDPAMTQKAESDWTALLVCGMDRNSNVYVVDRIRMKVLPAMIIEKTFELVEKWKLSRIGIERYANQLMLKYDLQREMRERSKYFTIEEMAKPKGAENKERFILRLQSRFEQGMIFLRRDMTDLVDEILSFPNGRHDDLLDALAYQLDYLVPASESVPTKEYKEGTVGYFVKHHLTRPEEEWQKRFFEDMRMPTGSDLDAA